MTSNSAARPPRTAARLVELFTSTQEADGVLGDLAEEFTANVLREGDNEARRHYRRQAWLTIGHLAVSPLRARPVLTAGIGLAGLTMTWPMYWALNAVAGAIVINAPVYHYVPASVFWSGVQVLGPLMTGFLVALVAGRVRFRPMSAALAIVTAMAILFAVDRPIVMWLSPASVMLDSAVAHWVRGVVLFGSPIVIGAASGRLVAGQHNVARRQVIE